MFATSIQAQTSCFNPHVDYGVGPYSFGITSADFNGDGKVDLAVTNWGSNNISVLMNTGTGSFTTAVSYTVGATPHGITSADFNGDGRADLAVSNQNSDNVSVLMNSGGS